MLQMLRGIPGEYLCGFSVTGMGVMAFVCSRYEWYWDIIKDGPWHRYDTPFWRAYTKYVGAACIVAGIGFFIRGFTL